jgi:hypothetical protein
MLSGYKTYIAAGLGVVVAIGSMFGFLPDGVSVQDPTGIITNAVMVIFLRNGIASASGK